MLSAVVPDDVAIRWAPIPGTPQEQFFDDDTADASIAFIGGWGSGKTMTLTAKALKLSALNAPVPGIWVVPDYAHIHDTILPTLEDVDQATSHPWFLRPDQFHYHETRHVLEWAGGGPILFLSGENPKSIAGPNVAWAAVDEPGSIKRQAWRNTVARVRHPGAKLRQKVAAGTPEGLGWFQEAFGDAERPESYRAYRMQTQENVELMKAHPNYITEVSANATEAELQAYLSGQFVSLDGPLAYPMFDEAIHWIDRLELDPKKPLLLTFDFNVNPMCCLVCQMGMGNAGPELYVLDAMINFQSTVDSTCDAFLAKFPRWPAGLKVYGDATGRSASVNNLKGNYATIQERLKQAGRVDLKVGLSNPPVTDRLTAVNRLLKRADGVTRLWIKKTSPTKTCPTREVVRSLQRTVKKPGTDDIQKKPGETVTHAGDALGYLCHAEFPVRRPGAFGVMTMQGL